MQISRHWRLNSQRYRLEGFRNRNGEVSLQSRLSIHLTSEIDNSPAVLATEKVVSAA